MKHTYLSGAPISERDAAWFEELAGAVARGRAALFDHLEADGNRSGTTPVCDTALSLIAATDTGASSEAAVRWLLAQEPQPGADAMALVLIALARSGNAARHRSYELVHRAINFLLALQNRDGGWPGFDRDVKSDPSCPAITARVLEALGHFGFRVGQPPIDAAAKFVRARQEETGEWRNRRGANELQATWSVIAGLHAIGFDVFSLPVRRAVRWLKESQNEDGGWGSSATTETAWALLALLATGEAESAEVRAGMEFLVGTQHADGLWSEPDTACFPLMALGRYLNGRGKPTEVRKAFVRTDTGHRATGPKSYRHTLAEM